MNNKMKIANEMQQQAIKTSFYFQDYYSFMLNIAAATIEWENLPDTVDPIYLERYLIDYGKCLSFQDDVTKQFFVLPFMLRDGSMDMYGNATKFTVQSAYNNYYNDTLDITNAVPIYANPYHTGEKNEISDFAYRLSDILMTMETNRDFCKTPALITAPRKMKMQIENAYAERKANVPAILGEEDFSEKIKFDVFGYKDNNLYMGDKLQQTFIYTWNEFLTWCGVANVQQQKRERLISDEVNRAMGGVMSSRNYRLFTRRIAAGQINKLFGLNIKVNFREVDNVGALYSGNWNDLQRNGAGLETA